MYKVQEGEWPQGGIRRLKYGEGGEAVECYWLLALAHQFCTSPWRQQNAEKAEVSRVRGGKRGMVSITCTRQPQCSG